ncbi:hypothetical protein [Tepidibacter mesophilus]|uniref:hypothetical protein n=1 Tax=Tepidibacter mesophilus TaxID=655607 RepID=UPI000C06C3F5|nr:hypothetical protein [Tepidibacter mesophilus]
MAYTAVDIVNKALMISDKINNLYSNFDGCTKKYDSFKLTVLILLKQLQRDINYYNKLKEEIRNDIYEEMDFGTYDEISKQINKFIYKINTSNCYCYKSIFKNHLYLNHSMYAVFIDAQGRIVKKENDSNSQSYKILSRIIKNKLNNLNELNYFYEKYIS